ncbi:hypothetical protein EZS27_038038 [termite gut metagenome]|uniref:Uncharacterized protein n=1 Tax=termite gut metagenome TaxID=433724 RepID=A0A5J4PQX4_9ZZZZ
MTEKEKTLIIQKEKTKISNLSDIKMLEIDKILLQESKVVPTWNNLISHFHRDENIMSEHIIIFLNNKENAAILSEEKIAMENPDEETVDKFLSAIILNSEINNESYSMILKSIPYYYDSLAVENLPKEKVELLIKNDKLGLTEENYTTLKGFFF